MWMFAATLAALLFVFAGLWLRYRIPSGPWLEHTTLVTYQLVDVGTGEEAGRFWLVEPLTGHRRVFLAYGPLPYIYIPRGRYAELAPEPPSRMVEAGYAVEVTYRTRRLLFGAGAAPAQLVRVRTVPGTPVVLK